MLMRIERDCFELAEIAETWDLTDADIRYLVGRDKLTLSVRLVAQPVLLSVAEEIADDHWAWVPCEELLFQGVVDLGLRDGFRLVRDGQRMITEARLVDGRLLTLRLERGLRLERKDALVRRAHWAAVRADMRGPDERGVKESFDFRHFVFDGVAFAFTLPQARALAFMVEQTRAGAPDQHHLAILEAAGASSTKLGNLFSRKPLWRRLVHTTPGRRGWYYLDPDFVIWLTRTG
jgi:hypothetical protein